MLDRRGFLLCSLGAALPFSSYSWSAAAQTATRGALDRLARDGVHFRNAFVTTALCSPSRASILTGLYAHQHRVVDNNHPIDPALIFFPQYLQQAGCETAFIGKWHMPRLPELRRL